MKPTDTDFEKAKTICEPLQRAVPDLQLEFSRVRVFGSYGGKSAISTIGPSVAGAVLSVLETLSLPIDDGSVKQSLRAI